MSGQKKLQHGSLSTLSRLTPGNISRLSWTLVERLGEAGHKLNMAKCLSDAREPLSRLHTVTVSKHDKIQSNKSM